jgi:CRP-like cAMP-binding protein
MSKCESCIIRRFNALRTFSSEELRKVNCHKISKTFKRGDVIFEEGEHLKGVYCIRYGISKLSKLSPNGKDQIIKFVSNGEVLGQRSVVSQEPANLKAVAVNDMEACFIPREIILDGVKNNPNFTQDLLKSMALEIREADDVIVNMSQKPVKQRVAEALFHLKNNFGEDNEGYLNITLSREDFSNLVGTATESFIRILSEFKKNDLLETAGKKIKILNTSELQQIAEGHN